MLINIQNSFAENVRLLKKAIINSYHWELFAKVAIVTLFKIVKGTSFDGEVINASSS